MFTGHIADTETARKSAGSALAGQNLLSVAAGSLSSVAVAQAAAATGEASLQVCDRLWAPGVQRGYKIASNLGGSFSSSYSALYASLPDSSGHIRQMINGG